jgi:hypothetical protein
MAARTEQKELLATVLMIHRKKEQSTMHSERVIKNYACGRGID